MKRATTGKEHTHTPPKQEKGRLSETELAPPEKPLPKKAGRKKSKVQISVRIDQSVMEAAYAHIRKTGDRITDFIERGFWRELNTAMEEAVVPGELRFLVVYAEPEERRLATALFVLLRLHKTDSLSSDLALSRDFILGMLAQLEALVPPKAWLKALADYGETSLGSHKAASQTQKSRSTG